MIRLIFEHFIQDITMMDNWDWVTPSGEEMMRTKWVIIYQMLTLGLVKQLLLLLVPRDAHAPCLTMVM